MDSLHMIVGREGEALLWWQMCLRALTVFAYGLLLIRLAGKRLIGRWGAFDLIIYVVLGSMLSRALTGNAPIVGTFAAAAVLVAVHSLLAAGAVRWRWLGGLMKGKAARLAVDGELEAGAMKRHAIGRRDLEEALRTAGLSGLDGVKEIWVERNGEISVITDRTR